MCVCILDEMIQISETDLLCGAHTQLREAEGSGDGMSWYECQMCKKYHKTNPYFAPVPETIFCHFGYFSLSTKVTAKSQGFCIMLRCGKGVLSGQKCAYPIHPL